MSTENYHHVNLTIEQGELHRTFTCTAPEDAPCRRRPPELEERESWTAEEATVPGADCWAVEWIEAVGIRDAIISTVDDQVLASVPVDLSFEEGVGIAPTAEPPEAELLAATRSLQGSVLTFAVSYEEAARLALRAARRAVGGAR